MNDEGTGPSLEPPEEFDVPRSGVFVTGGPDGIGDAPWDELPPISVMETAPGADADPATEFRRTLGRFATGVTVITAMAGEQVHGMTANAFMSVSLHPPLVLISVDKRARMHGLLHEGRTYGVSVLGHDQEDLSDHFAGRPRDHAPDYRFDFVHDTPIVDGAIANVVARVVRSYWGGDHSLFLGQVEYAKQAEGRPLLFHGGRYERLPLSEISIFAELSPDLQELIVSAGRDRVYEEGETLIGEGERGDVLFVVLEGLARVDRHGRTVATLGEGDVFGEIAVLDGGPRTGDVVADSRVRCLMIPREVLREVLLREPHAAWAMLEMLARRLRAT